MAIMTATEARKNLYRLIDEVNESHEPLHISGKRCAAVLVSEKDWYCAQEALYILSNTHVRESIFAGLNTPLDQCVQDGQAGAVAVFYTQTAQQDAHALKTAGFEEEIEQMLHIVCSDPYQTPPPLGKLVGDLRNVYCRRISMQHRLLYEVLPDQRTVKVLRMCSLYAES